MSQEKSLNERLAELCGLSIYDDPEHGYQYLNANGQLVCSVEAWIPTDDLNQLGVCYEAAEKCFGNASLFLTLVRNQYRQLVSEQPDASKYADNGLMVAIFKHPTVFAQAILKAKEVS
jgi:phosphoserine aminotransferase